MARFFRSGILPLFVLLTAIVWPCFAADITRQVEAFAATGSQDPPLDVLPFDAAKLYILFKTHGVTRGDKFRGVLIADHAGRIAPNTKVTEATTTLSGDTIDGDVSFSRPTNGWPPGDYHVEIYINDRPATTVRFKFELPKQTK